MASVLLDVETVAPMVAHLSQQIKIDNVSVVYNDSCINWQLMPFPAAILKCIDPNYTLTMHTADHQPRGRDHPALYKMVKIAEMLGIHDMAQNADGTLSPLRVEHLSPESAAHFKIIIEINSSGKLGEDIQVNVAQIQLNRIGAMIQAITDGSDLYACISQIKKITSGSRGDQRH